MEATKKWKSRCSSSMLHKTRLILRDDRACSDGLVAHQTGPIHAIWLIRDK